MTIYFWTNNTTIKLLLSSHVSDSIDLVCSRCIWRLHSIICPLKCPFFRALKHKRRAKIKWVREKPPPPLHPHRLPSTFHNSHIREVDSSLFLFTLSVVEFCSYLVHCFWFAFIHLRWFRLVLFRLIHSRTFLSFLCPPMYKAINFDNGFFLLFAHFICATLFVCTQIKVGPLRGFMHCTVHCMCVVGQMQKSYHVVLCGIKSDLLVTSLIRSKWVLCVRMSVRVFIPLAFRPILGH